MVCTSFLLCDGVRFKGIVVDSIDDAEELFTLLLIPIGVDEIEPAQGSGLHADDGHALRHGSGLLGARHAGEE